AARQLASRRGQDRTAKHHRFSKMEEPHGRIQRRPAAPGRGTHRVRAQPFPRKSHHGSIALKSENRELRTENRELRTENWFFSSQKANRAGWPGSWRRSRCGYI